MLSSAVPFRCISLRSPELLTLREGTCHYMTAVITYSICLYEVIPRGTSWFTDSMLRVGFFFSIFGHYIDEFSDDSTSNLDRPFFTVCPGKKSVFIKMISFPLGEKDISFTFGRPVTCLQLLEVFCGWLIVALIEACRCFPGAL